MARCSNKQKRSKRAKNKSTFGSIGGKCKKQSPRKAHKKRSKYTSKRKQDMKSPLTEIEFTVRLPKQTRTSKNYKDMPWFSSAPLVKTTTTHSRSSCTLFKNVPPENLQKLDDELHAFSQYIKLSPQEYYARESVVSHLQEICRSLFKSDNDVHVQAFGSFATPQLCTFQSDVDLCVWGVVPVPTHTYFADDVDETRKARSESVDSSTLQAVDRVQKWKDALAELDAQERSDEDIVQQQRERSTVAASDANCQSTMQQQQQGGILFVIDRVGVDIEEEKKEEEPTQACLQDKSAPLETEAAPVKGSAQAPLEIDESGSEASESDVDSADKLESYNASKNRAAASMPLYNDSSDSEQDDAQDSQGDDNLQVSIVSMRHNRGPAVATGETRTKVVGALKSLNKALWKSAVIQCAEVRKFARVPIIATKTHLGFETDLAIGGHNGADTSQYAATQTQRFASFAPVVLFLKILLAQQSLDKPFTGGLGSYKLYVIVAHHLEKHIANGGADRPSEVLVSFFYRFRNYHDTRTDGPLPPDTPLETVLSLQKPIECDGGYAELRALFKLEHCSDLFQQGWSRLIDDLESTDGDSNGSFLAKLVNHGLLRRERDWMRSKASNLDQFSKLMNGHAPYSLHSLGDGRAPAQLQQRWRERIDSNNMSQSVYGAPFRNGGQASFAYRNDSIQVASVVRKQPAAALYGKNGGDASAEQLMAGYGVKRSRRGWLIPRTRPDVDARKLSSTPEAIQRATKNRKNKRKQTRDEGLKEFALAESEGQSRRKRAKRKPGRRTRYLGYLERLEKEDRSPPAKRRSVRLGNANPSSS